MQAYAGKVTAGKIIVAGNTAKTTRRVARAQKTVQVRGSARSVRFEAVAARGARAAGAGNRAIALNGEEAPGMGMTFKETGKWRENLDLAGWAAEMRAIEKEYKAPEHFEADVKHLKKILTWANLSYFGGLVALAGMPMLGLNMPGWLNGMNPIAAFLMSTAICARWTMVGHHTCHGGYNAAQSTNGEVTGRFHRRKFAAWLVASMHRLDGLDASRGLGCGT
jgi:hypothetical protein